MNIKPFHISIDIVNEYFPNAESAFLTNSINTEKLKSVQIVIINSFSDYFTFEHFEYKKFKVTAIIIPKSILLFTEKHIDFIQEHDLFNMISKGIIIKETNSTGEKLQQLFEVINTSISSTSLMNLYKELFNLSNLISELENTQNNNSNFILKSKIVNKINILLKQQSDYQYQILKFQDAFPNDNEFLIESKSILERFGGPVSFYCENNILNNVNNNKIQLLIETSFSYDDFIKLFLIHLLSKLKSITHKIKFTFKLVNDSKYLITLWADNEIIKNNIIPTLNQIFISNTELYNNLKPKYPYNNKRQLIDDILIDPLISRDLHVKISQFILELKLNEEEELSDGYRLSLGIFLSNEILQILFKSKDKAKILSNIIFEEWLSASYKTSETNWNDLELQSHKILNEFENLYLAQYETLISNFGGSIKEWKYKNESGLELKRIIIKIYNSFNKESIFNSSIITSNETEGVNNSIQIILFDVLSILGTTNYNKTYIIYSINRLLHEA